MEQRKLPKARKKQVAFPFKKKENKLYYEKEEETKLVRLELECSN